MIQFKDESLASHKKLQEERQEEPTKYEKRILRQYETRVRQVQAQADYFKQNQAKLQLILDKFCSKMSDKFPKSHLEELKRKWRNKKVARI